MQGTTIICTRQNQAPAVQTRMFNIWVSFIILCAFSGAQVTSVARPSITYTACLQGPKWLLFIGAGVSGDYHMAHVSGVPIETRFSLGILAFPHSVKSQVLSMIPSYLKPIPLGWLLHYKVWLSAWGAFMYMNAWMLDALLNKHYF